MALCLDVASIIMSGPPSVGYASGGFLPSVIEPTASQTEITCTGYLLMTATEYRASGFFNGVSLSDVLEVSALMSISFAIAWGVRVIRLAL